jgi:hypothetical protein
MNVSRKRPSSAASSNKSQEWAPSLLTQVPKGGQEGVSFSRIDAVLNGYQNRAAIGICVNR